MDVHEFVILHSYLGIYLRQCQNHLIDNNLDWLGRLFLYTLCFIGRILS
jgi:hypothetical protein